MPAKTPNTITSIKAMLTHLQEIRTQGYAIDDSEQELGVRCVAVALSGRSTRTAISVSGPASRVTDNTITHIAGTIGLTASTLASGLQDLGK
jgi:IclR family acetate operon transcriptional repressor